MNTLLMVAFLTQVLLVRCQILEGYRDFGRWQNCTWISQGQNTSSFPFAFGCSKIVAPVNGIGINVMPSDNLDKYLLIYDVFPLAHENLCKWEPFGGLGFNMERTCKQYFCSSANSTDGDKAWLNKYIPAISQYTRLDATNSYDLINSMMHNYCFYCKERVLANDNFYEFHELIRQNGTCSNWTWTIPDSKCGGALDTGLPFSQGISLRWKLRSPTNCYCHFNDRYRFGCDAMNGMIVFFFEVIPFIGLSASVVTALITYVLVVIPMWVHKIRKIHVERKMHGLTLDLLWTQLTDLSFIAMLYLSVETVFCVVSDSFTLPVRGIGNERSIYEHQLDPTFLTGGGLLLLAVLGLLLLNWVNVLYKSNNNEDRTPLWLTIFIVVFLVLMTSFSLFGLIGNSVTNRYQFISSFSTYFPIGIGCIILLVYAVGFFIYGFRMLRILQKMEQKLSPFNLKFIRFIIMLFIMIAICIFWFILILPGVFGDQDWNYGLFMLQNCITFLLDIIVLLCVYLLFSKDYMPSFIRKLWEVKWQPVQSPTL